MKKLISVFIIGLLFGIGFSFLIMSDTPTGIQKIRNTEGVVLPNSYKYSNHGFTLEYPKELLVKEFDEGEGSNTIIFQKPNEQFGFQIFITPYSGTQITEERLRQDIKSEEIRRPTEILTGKKESIKALIFEADSSIIGETREVWFIENGYLYEITTYLDLDSWLSEILSTLEIIK